MFLLYYSARKKYYDFQTLISTEFLDELKQEQVYDGILIGDLRLCKKRLVNEDLNKNDFGCIRIDNENGIYFEEKTNIKRK